MNRTLKNIIIFLGLIVVACGVFFTMNYAKNNITIEQTGMNENMGEPPEKPEDTNNEVAVNEEENITTDITTTVENTTTDKEDDNDTTTPEDNEDTSGEEILIMPNDLIMNNGGTQELTTMYYVIFGGESLIFAILLTYLILSGFNKKTFVETFTSADKIIIYVLLTIILTGGFTYLNVVLTNNYFLNTTSNENNNSNEDNSNNDVTYTGVKEITEDTTIDTGTFSSVNKDENAILVNGKVSVTLSNITINKTGDSDGGDNTSFYGTNSAILAKNGATLILKGITVSTDASGANGVFSYGGSATTNNSSNDGTNITISDSKITTTGDNAGGIMTTGGGITNVTNLTITTSGTSSAAIRSDRGGVTVTVDKGTYTTNGQGSPAIYSTANISVSNATLNSNVSEGIVIEGANSVSINSCNVTDTNNKLNGQSTTYKNIFLYQSMSGDASSGNAEFTATDSTITTNKGDSFYITNTTAVINLTNNTIVNNDSTGNFLRAKEDSWGTSGSNGGEVTLTMTNQKVSGNIVIDSSSALDMTLKTNSSYEGTINGDNTAKKISLTLDKTSSIKLTKNSYVTTFNDADTSYSNIDFNGYKLYVNGKSIN